MCLIWSNLNVRFYYNVRCKTTFWHTTSTHLPNGAMFSRERVTRFRLERGYGEFPYTPATMVAANLKLCFAQVEIGCNGAFWLDGNRLSWHKVEKKTRNKQGVIYWMIFMQNWVFLLCEARQIFMFIHWDMLAILGLKMIFFLTELSNVRYVFMPPKIVEIIDKC